MTPIPSTEQQLLFKQQVMEHLDALYGMALSLTRNKADAEDVVQEAVIKAYKAFGTFTQGTNLKAWLFTIVRNTFINQYRRKKSRPEDFSLDDEKFSVYGQAAALAEIEQKGSAKEILDPERLEEYFGDEIMNALYQIPEDYREAVHLADIQEFSYAEIAEILEIPIGTVRSRLARGRKALQKVLWEYAMEKGILKGKS